MIECKSEQIRDALPDLLHGRLNELDTATMTAHVESCPVCRAELSLMREVRQTAPIAPAIDVARIVSSIPLRSVAVTPDVRKTRVFPARLWQLATAAALIAVGGWAVLENGSNGEERRGVAAIPSTAVAEPAPASSTPPIGAQPSTSVPRTAASPSATIEASDAESLSLVAGVQDLSDGDIEMLLEDLDGIDTVPSSEPQPVTITIDDIGEE